MGKKTLNTKNITKKPTLSTMQKLYANYKKAHTDFAIHQTRSRILNINSFDFSGVEAFTYNALINSSQHALTDTAQATSEFIERTIGSIQGDLIKIGQQSTAFEKTLPKTMKEVNDYLDLISQVANNVINLFQTLRRGPQGRTPRQIGGQVLRVDQIAQNIISQEQRLRREASKFLRPNFRTLVKIVPKKRTLASAKRLNENFKKRGVPFHAKTTSKQTSSSAGLSDLYGALMGGLSQALGTAYEHVLSLYLGKMPASIIKHELDGWATNLAETRKNPRYGGLISGTITNVNIPERNYLSSVEHSVGSQALIDWYVKKSGIGFSWEFTVSQKEYLETEQDQGELELAALSSTIRGKVTQVTDDLMTALALFRAFASPSSRTAQHGGSEALADAIMRHTLFDDIFGSGNDSISDFLINRVFYSAETIAQNLFNGSLMSSRNRKNRFTVNLGKEGTGASKAQDPQRAQQRNNARQTELGAANVWVSPERLLAIQKASFETHWVFEKAWFNNIVTQF